MIAANNVTLRLGKKALFEDVNIKFTEGNCYGIIGANGAGKSTFLRILSGQLDTTNGHISITPGQRLSFLEQDQNKYDNQVVLDTVIRRTSQTRTASRRVNLRPSSRNSTAGRRNPTRRLFSTASGSRRNCTAIS